jgi:hypothetical protein
MYHCHSKCSITLNPFDLSSSFCMQIRRLRIRVTRLGEILPINRAKFCHTYWAIVYFGQFFFK